MATVSKGIKRLSIVCGLVFALFLFLRLLLADPMFESVVDWVLIATSIIIACLLGGGIVRVFYWIYCRFKEDKEN